MKNRGGKQGGKQLGKTEADTLAGTTLQPRPPSPQTKGCGRRQKGPPKGRGYSRVGQGGAGGGEGWKDGEA